MYKPKVAYAIWTWGLNKKEQMIQALEEIKEAGFTKFESVKNTIDLFKGNEYEFKSIVDEYGVRPISFYFHQSGDPYKDIEDVKSKIEFLKANNVHRMSVQAPKLSDRPASQEELKMVLKVVEEIGSIAKKHDVVPCIHPHNNTMIMYENEIDFIMQNTDPEYIAFGPDTAHLVLGKCNPVEIFRKYIKRIKFVHLKDITKKEQVKIIDAGSKGFEIYSDFLELGEGNVDFNSIFKLLGDVNYDGYLTVELDKSRYSNKESAVMNMKYLKSYFSVLSD